MPFRKFRADHLFTGKEMLDETNVLITTENGVVKEIIHEEDAGDDIETYHGILSPGFVNCHCHLELSHMKNVVGSGTGLVDFLMKVVSNRSAVEADIQPAMIVADEEMYNAGIVAVGDICNTCDSISVKQKSGIRYHNFIEVLGFSNEKAKQRLAPYIYVYKGFCAAGFEKNTSIVPHAPYTVSRVLFELINEVSANKIVSIHNQESIAEDELYHTASGDFFRLYRHLNIDTDFFKPCNKSSLQAYLPLLDRVRRLILVHNTFSTQTDVDVAILQSRVTRQQIFWCLCPNDNLYIEGTLPPVELLKQNYCDIVLGTDSYSSNRSLSILSEMITLQNNFPALRLTDLLKWGTANGAKALDIDGEFGSFASGKQPGVVVIDNVIDQKLTDNSTAKRIL
jgi:cytosine/adenosine deaminase-related metal-dependent hydrolase